MKLGQDLDGGNGGECEGTNCGMVSMLCQVVQMMMIWREETRLTFLCAQCGIVSPKKRKMQ